MALVTVHNDVAAGVADGALRGDAHEREIEDLAALIATVGTAVHLYVHSSGTFCCSRSFGMSNWLTRDLGRITV